MKTPNTRFSAVTLALALAGACANAFAADAGAPATDAPAPDAAPAAPKTGPYNEGTTADGKTIVAPGTYGPFQTPTCEAGPACTAAAAASDLAATEGPLMDIGRQQMMESVKKDEDAMVKNGTYAALDRSPDGKGAVITLPNGMIAYSDYVKGFDSMPKTPADILKDPNAPAAMKAAAQKIVDANDPDKQQVAAADQKMFGGKPGGAGIMSRPDPAPTKAGAPDGGDQTAGDPPAGDQQTGGKDGAQSDQNGGTDISGMGGMIASAGNNPPSGGPGGSSDKARADNQRAMESVTNQAVETAGDADKAAAGLTYTRLADFARHSRALEDLRNTKVQSSNGADTNDDGVDGNDKTARGTGFFGR